MEDGGDAEPRAQRHAEGQTQQYSSPLSQEATQELSHRLSDELLQRGLDLIAEGDASGAAQLLGEAIAADPNHVEAHHGLIRALRDAGQHEDSIAAAKALTLLTPLDPLAYTSLSIALQKAGTFQKRKLRRGAPGCSNGSSSWRSRNQA